MLINWHDQTTLYGIEVKAYFFDGDAVKDESVLAKRALPFLAAARPKTLFTESDRQNFYCDKIVAQPDAVFEHGDGLISVEYKSVGGKSHNRADWRQSIRLKDMLQCLIAGYAVAQTYKKPTACVLRYHNVCHLLYPEAEVIHTVLGLIPMAMNYHSEERRISASQLAQFSIDKIRSSYSPPDDDRSAAGKAAHESLLRR
ncbi:hypothetical protein [Rhodocyclus gracilis]|uniref:Uncharacterized protein n=1 Tax=Rhodocyclus tenuis TaxID=1066 RepID=A0A6L5JWX0_RHOTE|nr:hypothetical protein [Rhodocyclus gracilis]MQY51302.1 hypothetical protein [Rhodocyclus gracilis]